MLARVTPLAVALALAVLLISAAPSATTQLAPSIYSIRPDGTGRALVVHLAPPVYLLRRSQDGQEIAFSRDLPPKQSLYVTDVSGKKDPVQIHPAGYPTFSPDGTRLAVENRMGLYVVNVDDTGLRRVAEAGGLASWSPDGRSLAYLVGGNTSWRSTIHVVSAEGGGDVEIATGINPKWAPRGNRIAYLGFRRGYAVPCFVDSDGSHRTCYHGFSVNNGFVWSPDGKRIAFVQAYPSRLAVVTARGQHIRRFPVMNRRLARTRILAWSPDGRWLAYAMERAAWQIYVRHVDRPGGERRVTAESRWSFLSTYEVRWVGGRISYIIHE